MKTSVVRLDNIKPIQFRFDASYHLSEGEEVKRLINASPYRLLKVSDASKDIFIGNRAKRVYVKKRSHGTPFLSSSDILQADLENVKIASNKYTPNIEQMKLQKGWTLISRSGTIGNCAFANAKHAQKLASEDVIRLVPNNILREGVVYAYLASKYGHSLLTQGTFGAVIQHIEPDYVGSLPIPNFPESFQKEVDDLIQESARLREEATVALEEAIKIFDNILGETEFTSNQQTKVLSSKQIFQSYKRFDSQYQIASDVLKAQLQKISGIRTIKIATIASNVFIGNRGKRMYVNNNGVPFMSSSDMMLFNALYYSKLISKKTPGIEDMIVKTGDILISRSGTVGNTIIVGEAYNNVAVSEHAMRLRINKSLIEPEYVYAYLLSSHGQAKLKSLPYGSVIITLGEEFLKDIDLPILDENKKMIIIELVEHYTTSMDSAIEKERKAISMVEQEIEKWNN